MLLEQIQEDLNSSLKKGEADKVSTLRFLLSALKNREIELRRHLTDEEILQVLRKQVRNHEESVAAFERGGRDDLAQKEKNELAILRMYQPERLSEEEIRSIVLQILRESGESDFGKAMKLIMGRFKEEADGDVVSRLVKEYLNKSI